MKKIIFIGLLLLIVPVVFAGCPEDFNTVEKFYEASMQEDFDSYISVMDTDYVYDYLAKENDYENYVRAAWEVYDVLDYNLRLEKCNIIPQGSIVFFYMDGELMSEGDKIDIERNQVAVFSNGKIQFVMDLETFSLHQSQAYFLQYYNVTKPIVEQELKTAEEKLIYASENPLEKKNTSFLWWLLIIIIILALIYYNFTWIKKSFSGFKKLNKKDIDNLKIKTKKLSKHAKAASSHIKKATKQLHKKSKEQTHHLKKVKHKFTEHTKKAKSLLENINPSKNKKSLDKDSPKKSGDDKKN